LTSQWAVDLANRIRLNCRHGAAGGDCLQCLSELEKIVMELDEERTNLKAIAKKVIERI